MATHKKIVLFDGVCNLCVGWIQFMIKKDTQNIFQFAALQSEVGQRLMAERGIDPKKSDSVVLIDPNLAYYLKSDAALEIGKSLKGYRTLSKLLLLFPRLLRNVVYDLIARYRYQWFGKKEECMIPSPEVKAKFLD